MSEELSLRNYAHIGDAVWEVFVREFVIQKTSNSKMLHKMTTDRVNATFQKIMLDFISSYFKSNSFCCSAVQTGVELAFGTPSAVQLVGFISQ